MITNLKIIFLAIKAKTFINWLILLKIIIIN